jgi:hypothetical protein
MRTKAEFRSVVADKEDKTMVTTIGMYDTANVKSVTMGVTINLQGFNYIKVDAECTDAETCRQVLIETLSMKLPFAGEVEKECVQNYLKKVLIKDSK